MASRSRLCSPRSASTTGSWANSFRAGRAGLRPWPSGRLGGTGPQRVRAAADPRLPGVRLPAPMSLWPVLLAAVLLGRCGAAAARHPPVVAAAPGALDDLALQARQELGPGRLRSSAWPADAARRPAHPRPRPRRRPDRRSAGRRAAPAGGNRQPSWPRRRAAIPAACRSRHRRVCRYRPWRAPGSGSVVLQRGCPGPRTGSNSIDNFRKKQEAMSNCYSPGLYTAETDNRR